MHRSKMILHQSLLGTFGVLIGLLFLASCDSSSDGENTIDFDRGAMLESVADGLIIPNFQALETSVNELATAVESFTNAPTATGLISMQEEWKKAIIQHQHCSAFGFGPGELLLGSYAEVLGVFPASESKIETNILNPDFDLANSFDRDVRGFHAIEYLIFRDNMSTQEVLMSLDANRTDYLQRITAELQSTIADIVEEWTSSYRQEFISNDATSAGSPISLYYNSFVRDYENLKNFKVELPAGLTADQQMADPRLLAGYYSGISRSLIEAHFASSKNIYMGLSLEGQELLGWEDYLKAVEGGPELIDQTQMAIERIDQAITNLPVDPLSENIEDASIIDLRDELQANTANFKSSIVSLLGLTITFNSGDGD